MIKKVPVKTFREEMVCDSCGSAMKFTGQSYPTAPMRHQHVCPECGKTEESTTIYPHTVYEKSPDTPEPDTRRRVIKDRAELCRVLLNMGYVPDEDGDFFMHGGNPNQFTADMWAYCGNDVYSSDELPLYKSGDYWFNPEWTEEY